jgi:hypothetical protein
LLFIEYWLTKGFEDEELKCSARIKEFALAIRGSVAMETKAREIVSLIDNPDYVRRDRLFVWQLTVFFRFAYANQGAVPAYVVSLLNGQVG